MPKCLSMFRHVSHQFDQERTLCGCGIIQPRKFGWNILDCYFPLTTWSKDFKKLPIPSILFHNPERDFLNMSRFTACTQSVFSSLVIKICHASQPWISLQENFWKYWCKTLTNGGIYTGIMFENFYRAQVAWDQCWMFLYFSMVMLRPDIRNKILQGLKE